MHLREAYIRDGLTPVVAVLPASALFEVQALIDEHLRPFYAPTTASLPLPDRLQQPLAVVPPAGAWSALMARANESAPVRRLIHAPEVRRLFDQVLGGPVEPFPISVFRARLPHQDRAQYDWHQDAGTWYVTSVGELADKAVATLWFSLNGATPANSIEIMPRRGRARLHYHHQVAGQGRFRVAPRAIASGEPVVVACAPGEGVFFDPLTLHRSAPPQPLAAPRFSIDIRYFRPAQRVNYPVDLRFRLRRWRALAALG